MPATSPAPEQDWETKMKAISDTMANIPSVGGSSSKPQSETPSSNETSDQLLHQAGISDYASVEELQQRNKEKEQQQKEQSSPPTSKAIILYTGGEDQNLKPQQHTDTQEPVAMQTEQEEDPTTTGTAETQEVESTPPKEKPEISEAKTNPPRRSPRKLTPATTQPHPRKTKLRTSTRWAKSKPSSPTPIDLTEHEAVGKPQMPEPQTEIDPVETTTQVTEERLTTGTSEQERETGPQQTGIDSPIQMDDVQDNQEEQAADPMNVEELPEETMQPIETPITEEAATPMVTEDPISTKETQKKKAPPQLRRKRSRTDIENQKKEEEAMKTIKDTLTAIQRDGPPTDSEETESDTPEAKKGSAVPTTGSNSTGSEEDIPLSIMKKFQRKKQPIKSLAKKATSEQGHKSGKTAEPTTKEQEQMTPGSKKQPTDQREDPPEVPTTEPRTRTKSKFAKGKGILPPATKDLKGNLKFTIKKQQDRYDSIQFSQIVPCKMIHTATLDELDITDDVFKFFHNIGWEKYAQLNCPAYVELVREFYATYKFKKLPDFNLHTPDMIKFRLLGKFFSLSITEFNLKLGFVTKQNSTAHDYLDSYCDYPADFNAIEAYQELTNDPNLIFDPKKSKANMIESPALRYIQRFLAYTFSGRRDNPGLLSKTELFFLWCMNNSKKVNLGCWIAGHISEAIAYKRPLILGSLITLFAAQQDLIDLNDTDLHIACPMEPLDLNCLDNMGLLEQRESKICFIDAGPISTRDKRIFSKSNQAQPTIKQQENSEETSRRLAELEKATAANAEKIDQIAEMLKSIFTHMGWPLPPQPESN